MNRGPGCSVVIRLLIPSVLTSNGNVILTKFSSLTAPEVVKMITSGATLCVFSHVIAQASADGGPVGGRCGERALG